MGDFDINNDVDYGWGNGGWSGSDVGSSDMYNIFANGGSNAGGWGSWGDWGKFAASMLPSIAGAATQTFGNIASNQLTADEAEKNRQQQLFLAQMGIMKDFATKPGGSSSSSWQEGMTGNMTDAQRLQGMRQSSQDKIAQLNQIMQGYYGARK